MKKLLFILLTGALFIGCAKSRTSAGNTNLLYGRWYAVKDTINTFVNGVQTGQTPASYHADANYVQFNTDGSGMIYVSEVAPAYSETFTYTQGSDNRINFNYPAQVVNGAQQQAYSRAGRIKILTESSLVLTFNTSQTVSGKTDSTAEVQYFSIN